MLISVVMPVRDGIETIDRALSSTRHLDGVSYEVIVSDGNSVDGTAEYLSACGSRVIVASHTDSGLYDGLNKAIARAAGRYILWLNADDELQAGVISVCRQAEETSADMITAEATFAQNGSGRRYVSDNKGRALTDASVLFGVPTINCRLLARQTIRELGGFRTDIGLGADREFLLRCVHSRLKRSYVPAQMYTYHLNASSRTMAGTWDSYDAVHSANLRLANALEEHGSMNRDLLESYRWLVRAAQLRAAHRRHSGSQPMALLHEVIQLLTHPVVAARALSNYREMRGVASGH